MNKSIKIYGCYNKNDLARKKSSSGGVFYALAKNVIESGGIVFGASYDENYEVIHSHCKSMEHLSSFMGSKYTQSSMGSSYKQVKEYLDKCYNVLFSGTPCQISGLKLFLDKDYDNLLTIDFICHGVPSRKIWREYKNKIAGKQKIKNVYFRDKIKGWRNFSLTIELQNGKIYRKGKNKDPYLLGFLSNLYLRPSCYRCLFKGTYRESDITMGDFWSADKNLLYKDDDKGLSVILIQTNQGQKLFREIKDELIIVAKPDVEFIKMTNSALIESVTKSDKRQMFYDSYQKGFRQTIVSLTESSIQKKIIRKIKKHCNSIK